jgi:hypothetical protein
VQLLLNDSFDVTLQIYIFDAHPPLSMENILKERKIEPKLMKHSSIINVIAERKKKYV